VAVALDYEKGQLHVLSVTAVDRGPDSLPAHVNIVVLRGDVIRGDVIRVDIFEVMSFKVTSSEVTSF